MDNVVVVDREACIYCVQNPIQRDPIHNPWTHVSFAQLKLAMLDGWDKSSVKLFTDLVPVIGETEEFSKKMTKM